MKRIFRKRILMASIGLLICGVGVGLFIAANMGADPATVFQMGVANTLNLPYGTASAIVNIAIIGIVLFIDKSYIHVATVLATILIGFTAQFVASGLNLTLAGESALLLRWIYLLVGCVVLAFGIPFYIKAGIGVGPIDVVAELITDKSNLSYRVVRTCSDFIYLLVGFGLGGVVGIGSLFSLTLLGVLIQFFRPLIDRYFKGFNT